jgi:hypothetical protein
MAIVAIAKAPLRATKIHIRTRKSFGMRTDYLKAGIVDNPTHERNLFKNASQNSCGSQHLEL